MERVAGPFRPRERASWRRLHRPSSGELRDLRRRRDARPNGPGARPVRPDAPGHPRPHRETAKEVELVVTGEETEIDKLVVERMADPFSTWSNAVSHGLEPAAERAAANKRPKGRITLRATAGEDDRLGGRGRRPWSTRRRTSLPARRRAGGAGCPGSPTLSLTCYYRFFHRARRPTGGAVAASGWTSCGSRSRGSAAA